MADQPRDPGARPGGEWLPPERSRQTPPPPAPAPAFQPPTGPPSPAGPVAAPAPQAPLAAPQPGPQQPYGHPLAAPHAAAREPGNGEATAALVLGIVAVVMVVPLGFLLVTLPIALVCGVIAIVLGRSGRQKVDRGETTRNRGQAQAGFVMGMVGTALAVLAVVAFALLVSFSEQVQRDLQRNLERQEQLQPRRPAAATPARPARP